MGLFLHKVYRLMSEKGLSYPEACRELSLHAARRRKALRMRKAGKWIPAKSLNPPEVSLQIHYSPELPKDHHLEQTFLDF